MSEYEVVKKSKLVLKGEKLGSKRKKKHREKVKKLKTEPTEDRDKISHGGWNKLVSVKDMSGPIAIEIGNQTYVKALDNGLFTLGPPHNEGEGPSPEEVLTGIAVTESKIALKSGYGKYLGVTKEGEVIGRSDAIGPLEQWEPVFQEDKTALLADTGRFMSVREDDDSIVALNKSAGTNEMVWIRGMVETDKETGPEMDPDERGSLNQIEINFVKKFQKFQDKKMKINSETTANLKKAKDKGQLHEELLNRRSKMKADRYCKI